MPTSPSPAPIVQCRGLTKTYGEGHASVRALRGVDLDVSPGELLVLMGPSGSGKTTLLSILSGILDPDEGECEILGRDLSHLPERERARFRGRSIGFVFQMFHLLPALTAEENVAVPLWIAGTARAAALEKARRALSAVGLEERQGSLPARMSGGEQQRVAIARALVHDPQLVVCDEPTSNLDHRAGREVMRILRDVVRQRGRSVIVVTHDSRALEFADRVAELDDGKITNSVAQGGSVSP